MPTYHLTKTDYQKIQALEQFIVAVERTGARVVRLHFTRREWLDLCEVTPPGVRPTFRGIPIDTERRP